VAGLTDKRLYQLSSIRYSTTRVIKLLWSKTTCASVASSCPIHAELIMLAIADRTPGILRYYEQLNCRWARTRDTPRHIICPCAGRGPLEPQKNQAATTATIVCLNLRTEVAASHTPAALQQSVVCDFHPSGRVIAGLFTTADFAIDARSDETSGD
jgi:hypothetical protein